VEELLKHSKKPFAAFTLFIALAGASLVTSGLIVISSNIVHVDVEYTVLLSASASNTNILLTARVRFNGSPVGAGINVDFYYSLNGGDWIYFASETTNHGGVARVRYTATIEGAYNFTATVSLV
jgi:hypothetical protein